MMHYSYNAGMWGWGWIFQLLILILFFVILWWMIRNSQSFGYKSEESAEEILKKRLARGEIDEEEYKKLKKEIE